MAIKTYGTMAVDWEQRIDFDRLRHERLEFLLTGVDHRDVVSAEVLEDPRLGSRVPVERPVPVHMIWSQIEQHGHMRPERADRGQLKRRDFGQAE